METLAPTNFPYLITRACTALPHTSAFHAMPDGFLRIVLRIVQKIDLKSPYTGIFASRATIAEESGKSIDSVHRAVKWLEGNGFIERERRAFFGNRGSTSPITPTRSFLLALNLVDQEGKPIASAQDRTGHPLRTKQVEPPKSPSSPAESTKAGRSAFVKVGNALLPKELAWLCEKGVSAFGVLALMRAAKDAQQRLSDIMLTARKYVEELPAREIFAYLRKLIGSGRDFGYSARKSEEIEKTTKISEFLANKLEAMEGRHYIGRKNNRTFCVEGGVLYEVQPNGTRLVHIISEAFVEAIHNGRIVPKRDTE